MSAGRIGGDSLLIDVAAVVAIDGVIRDETLGDFTDFVIPDSVSLAFLDRPVRTEAGILVIGLEVMDAIAFIDSIRCLLGVVVEGTGVVADRSIRGVTDEVGSDLFTGVTLGSDLLARTSSHFMVIMTVFVAHLTVSS